MNYKNYLKKKLKNISEKDVIISEHAKIRMIQRQISEKEVIENIINPERLDYAEKQLSRETEEIFGCYFGYSKTQCHFYVLKLKNNIVVVTVIKINKRWQKIAEKKVSQKNR